MAARAAPRAPPCRVGNEREPRTLSLFLAQNVFSRTLARTTRGTRPTSPRPRHRRSRRPAVKLAAMVKPGDGHPCCSKIRPRQGNRSFAEDRTSNRRLAIDPSLASCGPDRVPEGEGSSRSGDGGALSTSASKPQLHWGSLPSARSPRIGMLDVAQLAGHSRRALHDLPGLDHAAPGPCPRWRHRSAVPRPRRTRRDVRTGRPLSVVVV